MKISSSQNNYASFGSFSVVVPSVKSENETFKLLYQGIKKVYPETQIKHNQSKQTIGIIKRTIYSIFNITGKNEAAENQMAAAYATAGFQVLASTKTTMERVAAGFKALLTPVKIVAENAPKLNTVA